MEIAGRLTDADWVIRKNELAADGSSQLWEKTFDEFMMERIETRYLAPMNQIADIGQDVGEGFSIVALFCTLVEFLEGCEQGMNFDQDAKPSEPHKYGIGPKGKELFQAFLKREPFKSLLGEQSATFYSDIRCGLLHEARTCRGWKIRPGSSSGVLVEKQGSDIVLVLYRNRLEPALMEYLTDYRSRLAQCETLQKNFITKWDHLASR